MYDMVFQKKKEKENTAYLKSCNCFKEVILLDSESLDAYQKYRGVYGFSALNYIDYVVVLTVDNIGSNLDDIFSKKNKLEITSCNIR